MDHLRAILIFLVVFGHFLEVPPADCPRLYRAIYAFHIPALLFLSGRFAHFSWRRIRKLLLLYAVFQVLYRLFDWLILGQPQKLTRWLFVPYWHLWYLILLAGCLALVPLLEKLPQKLRLPIVLVSFLTAAFWGFAPISGYWFSFGRFLSFFPFFLTGLYCKNVRIPSGKRRFLLLLPAAVLSAAGTWLLLQWKAIPNALLFGAVGFRSLGAGFGQKLFLLVLASLWVCSLLLFPWPPHHLPFWSSIGKNTLPLYLLHGFVVRSAEHWSLFSRLGTGTLLPALASSLLLTLLFAHPLPKCRKTAAFFSRTKGKKSLFSPNAEKKD